MIVAEIKEIAEIRRMIDRYSSILVVGCDSCVAECAAGGNRETMLLAAALRLSYRKDNKTPVITESCLDRQCVDDFIERIAHLVPDHEAILSLGCGAGVQALARVYSDKPIIPALDTLFIGETEMRGIWQENCLGCGKCKLGLFRSGLSGHPVLQEAYERSLRGLQERADARFARIYRVDGT